MRFDPNKFKSPLETCPFAKHEDEPWEDVLESDRLYIEWLVSGEGPKLSERLYDHLISLLEGDF